MKTVQYFSEDYLSQCAAMSANDIARFVDEFRQIHGSNELNEHASKLISIKVPLPLLTTFKMKAKLNNLRYQTKIKELMTAWVVSDSS